MGFHSMHITIYCSRIDPVLRKSATYTACASCDAMCFVNALADGAEGLHFSAFAGTNL